jgi:hypothetical protein
MDDLFDEPAEQATATETATEEQAAQETGVEETQAAADTTAQTDQTATNAAAEAEKGLQAALLAERQKRQEVERRLAEKEQEQKPDFWEDPEARLTELDNRINERLVVQKLDISESFAREKYADFDSKLDVFKGMMADNPTLYHQMVNQSNPAEFMYKTAASQQKLREMGDPSEYEKKLTERITAELEAKYAARLEEETKKRSNLPGSIATVSAAGGATSATWSGPTSLDDLLK